MTKILVDLSPNAEVLYNMIRSYIWTVEFPPTFKEMQHYTGFPRKQLEYSLGELRSYGILTTYGYYNIETFRNKHTGEQAYPKLL